MAANHKFKKVHSTATFLYQIFSAPLMATVKAEELAAKTAFNFIKEVGFSGPGTENDNLGNLRMVTFSYQDLTIEDGEPVAREVIIKLPLLSLFPLPLLQVQDANFKFDVRILEFINPGLKSHRRRAPGLTDGTESSPGQNQVWDPDLSLDTVACLSPRTPKKSGRGTALNSSANVSAEIRMRQADMPGGIANMLQIVNNATRNVSQTIKPEPRSSEKKPMKKE